MPRDLAEAFALLGLAPTASADDVAAAYRARAKRLHPDAEGDVVRMSELNVAHDLVTAALLAGARPVPSPARTAGAPRRRPGHWLPAEVRRRLGPELVGELGDGEAVEVIARVATWASPRTVLVLTDRRLVWLLDDAVGARVRRLPRSAVAGVELRGPGRRRRTAELRVRPHAGRRIVFTGAEPETARRIADALGRERAAGRPGAR